MVVADALALAGRPVDEVTLRELTRRIVTARPVDCVLLFGSRARGDHKPDSDVDLLVVTPTDRDPLMIAGELYGAISGRDFSVDLVVMTPEQFSRQASRFDPFMHDVLKEGKLLYGALPGNN